MKSNQANAADGGTAAEVDSSLMAAAADPHRWAVRLARKLLTIGSQVQQMSNFVDTLPITEIAKFCQRWKIRELAVFGSALRDDFSPDSDVDILVTFTTEADWGLLDHVKMQQEFQALLQRSVDLITKRALERSPNWLRRSEILKTAQIIFSERKAIHAT